MLHWKHCLGIAAVGMELLCYIPYFQGLWRGQTKPHIFSWLIWATSFGLVFAVQIVKGGGAGSWATGTVTVCCLVIAIIALRQGETRITKSDWAALAGAALALLLWPLTHNPLWSVIMMTWIDALGFYPTFRKSWSMPFAEAMPTYLLSTIGSLVSLPALDNYSLVNMLFPVYVSVINAAFVAMLLWRRKAVIRP